MTSNHRTKVTRGAIVLTAIATAIAALGLALSVSVDANAAAKGTAVSTAKTSLGQVLVNSRGHTLYLFGKDRSGKSSCSGQCATFWPPLIASGKPAVGGGAKASLIGTVKRADGRRQVTYNHHPLYTFVKDKSKGQTNGEGVSAFGSKWYAVSPAGAKVLPRPAGNGIPQNNGGDGDSDNNGGPSDGDGNI
jgi:predicted lipoprotein with Yx(FWY)xxD motif